jgi:hypothetical protein
MVYAHERNPVVAREVPRRHVVVSFWWGAHAITFVAADDPTRSLAAAGHER